MKRHSTIASLATLLLATLACAVPHTALAQSLGDLLRDRVKRATTEEVENKADQAARKVVRCALGDEQCIRTAKKKGAKVETYEPENTAPESTEPVTVAPVDTAPVSALPDRATTTPVHAVPSDIKPVPSGAAVPLAKMQASCDANAVGRTTAARKDVAFAPGPAGAAAVLAKIKPIFPGFAPNGFETRTGGTEFTPGHGMPANMNPWNFHVLSYPYGCLSNGKFHKDEHYAFSAYIAINDGLNSGPYRLPDKYTPDSPNGDGTGEDSLFGFYKLEDNWLVNGLPQPKDGYFHIRGEYTDIYWFTRGGQLPYAYVSREEFLRKQIGILQTGAAHTRREMTRAYTAGGQPVDHATINSIVAMQYEKPTARYQQLLKQPAAWLQQPAFVRMNYEMSYEFLDASQVASGVQVPIKPNPNYLDKSKAAGEPQYLAIRMNNSHKRGEYYLLRELIERNAAIFKALVK